MRKQELMFENLRTRFDMFQTRGGMSVADAVFRALRLEIVTIALPPGTRLTEQEIGDQLHISRQPVREALVRLRDIELVVVKAQRGSFVAPIDATAVRSAQFVREAIETAIVRRAAASDMSGEMDGLEELLAAQETAVRRADAAAFFRLDERFHCTLAAMVGCSPAWRTIENVKGHMDRVRYLSLPDATPLDRLMDQHREIADAIAAGAPGRATKAMEEHLREIILSLPVLANRYPDLFQRETETRNRLGADVVREELETPRLGS
jgi:DNA-binding GntR family transcriptional regulator